MALERGRLIKKAAEAAPWYVLHCPKCPDHVADSYEQDFHFNWSLKLRCDQCQTWWWVCRKCPMARSQMTTVAQASRHNRLKHTQTQQESKTEEQVSVPQSTSNPETICTQHITRPASIAFFNAMQSNSGSTYLAMRAIFHEETGTKLTVPDDDIKTFLTTAHFVSTLSRGQREDLAALLEQVTKTTRRQILTTSPSTTHATRPSKKIKTEQKSEQQRSIQVLTSKEKIRSTIITGKFSLYENLAHPQVYSTSTHAYILPSDAVADFLAHGSHTKKNEAKDIHKVQSIANCKLAREIHKNNSHYECTTLIGTLWSDGFEPNYSLTNRGSAWIMTLTIQAANSENPGLCHVYPLAVGKESDNNNEVLEIIMNNMFDLERKVNEPPHITMYNGSSKQNEKVSFHLIGISQDQPERRNCSGLLGGNSTIHARYGYRMDFQSSLERQRPCASCEKDMKSVVGDVLWEHRTCAQCHNWMLHHTSFPAEKGLPIDESPDNGMFEAQVLEYSDLVRAGTKTYNKVFNGDWNKGQARTFLHSWCINKEITEDIILRAENCRAMEHAIREGNPDVISIMDEEKEENPSKFTPWEPPALWKSSLTTNQSFEVPMHLFFLGLVSTTVIMVQDWSGIRNKATLLQKTLEQLTLKIENMHLSWCRVSAYRGKKLGGWFSDAYLGFARLLPWMYSILLSEDFKSAPPYEPPKKPQKNWTRSENSAWLGAHGLPRNGKAKDLAQRVRDHMGLGTSVPEAATDGAENEILLVLVSLWAMVSFIMGMVESSETAQNVSARLIRIFLTHFYDFDLKMRPVGLDKKPAWLSHYNFMSLLNLPSQIGDLGPVRNRWEGGIRGERFIQRVKPQIRSVNLKNFPKNLLTNLLRQRELLMLKSSEAELEETEDDCVGECDDVDFTAVTKYPSVATLILELTKKQPLSCVIANKGEKTGVYCCFNYGKHNTTSVVEFFWDQEAETVDVFGMSYLPLKTSSAEGDEIGEIFQLKELEVKSYGLLLPLLEEQDVPLQPGNQPRYTLVTSDWKTLNRHGRLVLPHYMVNYDKLVS